MTAGTPGPGSFSASLGGEKLFSAESAQDLDTQAPSWGLDPLALVEAAGRLCARLIIRDFPQLFSASPPKIVVAAGSGNNGADALVMLRSLILEGRASPAASAVVINRLPGSGDHTPRSEALRTLDKMGLPIYPWRDAVPQSGFAGIDEANIIIDGIAGTGLRGPLSGAAGEMAAWIGECKQRARAPGGTRGEPPPKPWIVSIDVPSGNFDGFEPSMPIIQADLTLAIEPKKACL
ncbi:MAG: NAD(P)H-hydrate epimerase, partial [Spirochaetaceae bacterium]|nr:NAD(P)H-hydrate epimerase [Spirochaetaceae bacterium]